MALYRKGDYASAERAFSAVPAQRLKATDVVRYYHAQAAYYAGHAQVAAGLFGALAAGKGRFADRARYRQADALDAAGRADEARAAYARALAKAPGASVDATAARLRYARLLAASDPARARAEWTRVVVGDPTHPGAGEAAAALAAAGTKVPEGLDGASRIARAQALGKAHAWAEAAAELAALGDSEDLRFRRGMALYHTRKDYEEAARLLAAVAPALGGARGEEAAFHAARSLSRTHKDREAVAAYEALVARAPGSRFAAEASFLAGYLRLQEGDHAGAATALQVCAARYGKSAFGDDAGWFLALAYWLGGKDELARQTLERLKAHPGRALQARYWLARLAERRGAKDAARAGYTELAQGSPLGWYGALARSRLRSLGAPLPAGPRPAAPAAKEKPLAGDGAARVRELVRAGLPWEAAAELERVAVPGRLPDLLGAMALARAAGDWARVYRYADRARGVGGGLAAQQGSYPLAFEADVTAAAKAEGLPRTLLFAIMRKESGFDPTVVSYANAIGLLQMLPETARRVADKKGRELDDDELFDPATNVALGAGYVGRLWKKFRGQIPLVAAGFNGGSAAMMRWLKRLGPRPLDEFIELVPFHQSREYAKLVAGNFATYEWLYRGELYVPPLEVEAEFQEDDVDY